MLLGIIQGLLAGSAIKRQESPQDYEGEVVAVVKPGRVWQVCYKASFWLARSRTSVDFRPGDWIRVVGRWGIVLIVEPLERDE